MLSWKKGALIISVTIVLLYASFMAGYYATSFPSFCAVCHIVKPYVVSWRQSSHKDINCLYCHEPRGFLGKVHSKSRGLNYLYQELTGQHTIIIEGQIFEQNCVACHLGDYYDYPDTVRLDSKHYQWLKSDRKCLECHITAGHGINLFTAEKFNQD